MFSSRSFRSQAPLSFAGRSLMVYKTRTVGVELVNILLPAWGNSPRQWLCATQSVVAICASCCRIELFSGTCRNLPLARTKRLCERLRRTSKSKIRSREVSEGDSRSWGERHSIFPLRTILIFERYSSSLDADQLDIDKLQSPHKLLWRTLAFSSPRKTSYIHFRDASIQKLWRGLSTGITSYLAHSVKGEFYIINGAWNNFDNYGGYLWLYYLRVRGQTNRLLKRI